MSDDPPRLSGTSVRDVRWAFEQILGVDCVARALAALPDEVRLAYADATPLSWVPYDVVVQAHDAIAREAGTTMEALLRLAVPRAVERSFGTVWRILVRLTSDEALIARTPLIYSRSRSKGTMTAKLLAPGDAEAVVTGWVEIPDRDMLSLAVGIEKVLELSGRAEASVRWERTADGARFSIRFRA